MGIKAVTKNRAPCPSAIHSTSERLSVLILKRPRVCLARVPFLRFNDRACPLDTDAPPRQTLREVGLRPCLEYVIGLLCPVLGNCECIVPICLVDIAEGRGHWPVLFVRRVLITMLGRSKKMIRDVACANGVKKGLTISRHFLLTQAVWLMLRCSAHWPFIWAAKPRSTFVDAVFFEAPCRGMTTQRMRTVFTGLDDLPKGLPAVACNSAWLVVCINCCCDEFSCRAGGLAVKCRSFQIRSL